LAAQALAAIFLLGRSRPLAAPTLAAMAVVFRRSRCQIAQPAEASSCATSYRHAQRGRSGTARRRDGSARATRIGGTDRTARASGADGTARSAGPARPGRPTGSPRPGRTAGPARTAGTARSARQCRTCGTTGTARRTGNPRRGRSHLVANSPRQPRLREQQGLRRHLQRRRIRHQCLLPEEDHRHAHGRAGSLVRHGQSRNHDRLLRTLAQ
jgi:hypothetical protein